MLSNKNRLRKQVDIKLTRKKGKFFQEENFGLSVYGRQDRKDTRIGIVVSTKISKKAVERNRIKRLYRELIKTILPELKLGYDILFLVKKSSLSKNIRDLKNEMARALKRANLL